jgi:hypothetical protein
LRKVIEEDVPSEKDKAALKDLVQHMENAQDRESFTRAYQDFIYLAAAHMTIIAPFLPALTKLL